MSPKGSERIAWNQIPGGKQPCHECGRELKVSEIGEVRTDYPGGKPRTRVYGFCCPVGRRSVPS